jgi:MFS family permease
MNGVGLAIGSLIFIPCALKWGRRPIYLLSILVTLLCGVWFAVTHTYADLMGAYFLCGVSGAVSEAMVQMTVRDSIVPLSFRSCGQQANLQINDMFFVHERGTMVSIYLACTNVGVSYQPPISPLALHISNFYRFFLRLSLAVMLLKANHGNGFGGGVPSCSV